MSAPVKPEGMSIHEWRNTAEYQAWIRTGAYLTSETHCARCVSGGHPSDFGSEIKCGFKDGVFVGRDWNCRTLGELRRIAYQSDRALRWNDQSIAVIPRGEWGFIVLTYYKDRGATDRAYCAEGCTPITLEQAEEAIANGPDFVRYFGGPPDAR